MSHALKAAIAAASNAARDRNSPIKVYQSKLQRPVVPKNRIRTDSHDEAESAHPPTFDPHLLGTVVLNLFRSRRRLEARTFFFGISSILP